ncbi:MAG: hypothetical protein U0Q16_25780 [Bryobacteraceae bacterium]
MSPITRLFGMILFVLAGLGALLMLPVAGETLLEVWVTPKEGDTSSWANSLLQSGLFAGAAILLLDLIWFALAQWVWRVSDYRKADKRAAWLILAIAAAVCTTGAAFWPATALEAGFFPWIFLFYVALFVWGFYLATAWFSPPAYKYTPLLAEKLRFSFGSGK